MIENRNKKKTVTRAKICDMTPIVLQNPIGIGEDMISSVVPQPLTIASIKKYKIQSLNEEYLETLAGMSDLCMAVLPNIADEYKEQLSLSDMMQILERFGSFMSEEQ